VPHLPPTLKSELRRAAPLTVPLIAITLLVWLAGVLVLHSRVNDWDLSVDRWLADHRVGWLNTFTEWGTWLAETVPVLVLIVLAVVLARVWTHGWRTSVFLASAVAGEKLIYIISSTIVARGRPPLPTLDDTYATNSFPSGHVGSAITLYGAIAIAVAAWRGRRYLGPLMGVMTLFTAIVAFARMYRGFHYPSDVIASVIIGTVWLALTVRVVRPLTAGPLADARSHTEPTSPARSEQPSPSPV
jgi:undecaprenyl-diphosphatase